MTLTTLTTLTPLSPAPPPQDSLMSQYKDQKVNVDIMKEKLQSKITGLSWVDQLVSSCSRGTHARTHFNLQQHTAYAQAQESGDLSEDERNSKVAEIHGLKEKLKTENEKLKTVRWVWGGMCSACSFVTG